LLLVEDNADVRAFIRQNLKTEYRLLEAANGKEGYDKAVETIPDLILSDVMMPVMDGVELCTRLKSDEKTSHIPIILLTAKARGVDRIEGLQTGADDYITKPFAAEELKVRIENLIESRRKLREQFSREILLQPTAIKITSADEQFLQQVMEVIEANMANFNFGEVELRKEMHLSKTQLYRKMKGLTDHSPGEFIQLMRLKRAAEMLAARAGNVGEISFAVGFRDHSYFSRRFHKQYGMSPSEYATSVAK
jgi:DNA-binding response OmpR family regulator